MNIIIPDLNETTTTVGEEIPGDGESVTEVAEVGMDTQIPGVTECLDLFGLAGQLRYLCIFDGMVPCTDLPRT
jgi:hypothetical protein